jgi:serine/threonine protein phosphatase 1
MDALLDLIDPTDDDHLVFIGDYIDRGPDSKGVIDRLLTLRDEVRCTFLRGNHEALMLEFLEEGESDVWVFNGGTQTMISYQTDDGTTHIPRAHVEFLQETELYLDTEDFLFVHAGIRADMSVEQNLTKCDESVFLWERDHLGVQDLPWEKTVVCGHTPVSEPVNRERLINIDTGCVFHAHAHLGRLTAVRLPEREFIHVPYSG